MKKLIRTDFQSFFSVNEFVASTSPMRTHYGSTNPIERWIWHGKLAAMKDILGRIRYSDVLDIGCGDGGLLGTIDPTTNYTGIDISPTQLAYFKSILPTFNKHLPGKVSLTLGDATRLPFKQSSFDLVLACDVLEHVLDPTTVLNEIRRVLKPDGYSLFSIPNEPVWQVLRVLSGRWPPRSPDHLYFIEPQDIMRSFPKVAVVKYLPFSAPPLHLISILLVQRK